MKKLMYFSVLVAVVLGGMYVAFRNLGQEVPSTALQSGKLRVITTLYPLYDFAREVGGEGVNVSLLLPPGVESHTFEPTPNDVVKIHEADVFIYTGKFAEPWAEDVMRGVSNKNTKVVDSSVGIEMVPGVFYDADEPAGSMDPHIWLDFDNARRMVETVRDALIEKDPANSDRYRENAKVYAEKLSLMDDSYQTSLQLCASRKIVYGGHYAFGYLARRYGLEYVAAQGLSPDAEPSAQDLAQLVEQVRRDDIKYVFYEELTSPKIAETIAGETKAKLLLLNAAHNISKEDFIGGVTFLSLMEENRKNLVEGLGCQ